MAKVKMDQLVRWSDGTIRTPAQLLDSGVGEVEIVERFYAPRSKKGYRRAVFVQGKSFDGCVEVSGFVAKSRADCLVTDSDSPPASA